MQKLFINICLFLFFSEILFAQLGKPIITNYKNNHFQIDFTVHDIAQGPDGIMYFATSKGLITYNGSAWKKISEPGNIPFFKLLVNEKYIYLSGKEHFGYLEKKGHQFTYVSISDSLVKKGHADIVSHSIVESKNKVYFIGNALIGIEPQKTLEIIDIPAETHTATYFKKNVLIHVEKDGFYQLHNAQDWMLHSELQPNYGKVLFIHHVQDYFYIVYETGEIELYDRSFQKLYTLNSKILNIHDIEFITEDYLAIASDEGVVLYSMMQNEELLRVNKKNSLESERVLTLTKDVQNNLWIGTDKGISKAEIFLPFSFYSEESNLPGSVNDVLIQGQEMYVATNFGLYRRLMSDSTHARVSFERISPETMFVFDLEWIDSTLIFSTKNELYYLKKIGEVEKIDVYKQGPVRIQKVNSGGFITYSSEGILYYKKCKEIECNLYRWKSSVLLRDKVSDVVLKDSTTLCYIQNKKLYELSINTGKPKDLNVLNTHKLFALKNKLLALNDTGLVKISWKDGTQKTKPYFFIDGAPNINQYEASYLVQTSLYDYLIYSSYKNPPLAFFHATQNESKHFVPLSLFRRLPSLFINNIINDPYKSGNFWVCTENGLVEFSGYIQSNSLPEFTTVLSDIYIKNMPLLSNKKMAIPYDKNTISFEFSSTNYIVEELNEYSYVLEGSNEASWTPWSPENKVTFASLPAGNYVFKVKSKNLYQQESKITTYTFSIVNPWYQSTYMYFIYFFMLFGLFYILMILYTDRLKKSNLKLQRLVEDRTQEIRLQKEEIEEKNKNITSSIEYARTIQEAILTSKEYLQAVLKDFFVYYVPRDIIGGDFYWAYQSPSSNKVIVAVGDCTGHGVPGALMSMIGYSLLNEIIIENKVEQTHEILDQLRNGIINSFQQTNTSKIERSHDGMDISLICIDFDQKIMSYSCAKQIILLARDGAIIELESDFQPISNFIANLQAYQSHQIELKENDMIYLFTDGFPDQFGGEKGKKFMHKQFKQLLQKHQFEPTHTQEDALRNAFLQWKGSQDQVDDICVLGIRIT